MEKEYISFSKLYTENFEVADIFAMRQKWYKGKTFVMDRPRRSNGIIFLNNCAGLYSGSGGEELFAPRGSLICLPAGSKYRVLNLDCDAKLDDAYLVEFNIVKAGEALFLGDFPFHFEEINSYLAAQLTREVVEAYEATISSPSAIKAAIYRLIASLGKESIKNYNKKYRSIETGIELIESDVLGERSIEDISDICGVSSSCFRKLFREYSGKSPLEYRIDLKLGMAKNMLTGSNITVEQVADALGFDSSAYFCRLFKSKTGLTPNEYRKSAK